MLVANALCWFCRDAAHIEQRSGQHKKTVFCVANVHIFHSLFYLIVQANDFLFLKPIVLFFAQVTVKLKKAEAKYNIFEFFNRF
jgi:hypothetical protein